MSQSNERPLSNLSRSAILKLNHLAMPNCYICDTPLESATRSMAFVDAKCFRCGHYHVSTEAEFLIQPGVFTQQQIANILGHNRENQGIEILTEDLDRSKLLRTATVGEKARKGLLAIATLHSTPGEAFAGARAYRSARKVIREQCG
jgi:hypothetical protein